MYNFCVGVRAALRSRLGVRQLRPRHLAASLSTPFPRPPPNNRTMSLAKPTKPAKSPETTNTGTSGGNRSVGDNNADMHALQTCGDDIMRTVNLLCSVSPRHGACSEFGNELHELSLSTGTLDRQMVHFVCDVLLDTTTIDSRRATDSSLRNALSLARRTPHVKRTSLLRGGVASFYFLTSLVLREARVAIRKASTICAGGFMRRRMLSGSVFALALLQIGKKLLKYRRMHRALPTLYSAVYAGLASWLAITYYQMRRPLNKLKQCNRRLLHLLRMWSIVQSVVSQASRRRAASYIDLLDYGGNQSSGQKSEADKSGGVAAKSYLR